MLTLSRVLLLGGAVTLFGGCGDVSQNDMTSRCRPIITQRSFAGQQVPAGVNARMFRVDLGFPLGCVPDVPETTHLLVRGWMSLEGTALESVHSQWDMMHTPVTWEMETAPNPAFPLVCHSAAHCAQSNLWYSLILKNNRIPGNEYPFTLFFYNTKDMGGTLRLRMDKWEYALWNEYDNFFGNHTWHPVPGAAMQSEWFEFATTCRTQC